MANLLGVTNPVPGFDGANHHNLTLSPNDPQIQNVPDPGRVGRADARTDREDSGAMKDSDRLRYESNFQTFLQRLREAPSLAETLSRILAVRQGTLVLSGIGEGTAAELSQVLELLRMDREQLLEFLTGQMRSGTRFGGALFALLRGAYAQAGSEGLRGDILQFLRCYSDHSSTAHLERGLLRGLRDMAAALPKSWAGELEELAGRLENRLAAGDRAGSLRLIQREVFPYMAAYVERTHDVGPAREALGRLALDLARYENGSEENLLQAFHRLTGYGGLRDKLGGIDDRALLSLLHGGEFAKAAKSNRFADHLAAAAAGALRGEGGAEAQEVFRALVGAMLVNESVYMPLNHILLPLEWEGRALFSELWVDPDAEEAGGEGEDRQARRTVKVLFKMDVQDLGAFDVVILSRDKNVSVQIFCPERVAPYSGEIARSVTGILERNDLLAGEVRVRKRERALALTEVFPNLFEGVNSVNVKA